MADISTSKRKFDKEYLKKVPFLILGAAILAFGMFNIHSRCAVTEGGILGLTLLIKHWFGITQAVTELILDLTCYFIGFKMLGKDFLKSAIIASVSYSTSYKIFEGIGPVLPNFSDKPLIAAILGGLFVGVGVGIVVRQGGASGGDDALALIISKLTKCKLSHAYMFTDITVLLVSLSYIPFKRIFFSLITVTISSYTIDIIQAIDFKKIVLWLKSYIPDTERKNEPAKAKNIKLPEE